MFFPDFVSLQSAEEVQISLVWYPSVNNQDLSINNGGDGQEAKDVLKQLENLTAVYLSATAPLNKEHNSDPTGSQVSQTQGCWPYLILLHHFFCEPVPGGIQSQQFETLNLEKVNSFPLLSLTWGSSGGPRGSLGSGACSRGKAVGRQTAARPLQWNFSRDLQSPH